MTEDSTFLRHEPCPECGSSDALARYSDGHAHCFACGHYEKAEGDTGANPKRTKRMAGLIEAGTAQALSKRQIDEETCRKFGYTVGTLNDKPVQIAAYRDADGSVVAQKVRFPNKEFTFLGTPKQAQLFGQHLWRDQGKMVIVTEGEIDCLTVSMLQGNKWPVVSVQNGASGAANSIKKAMEWLCGFETVVFMFDMDEPGRKAARECAELLPAGKSKIAELPAKDANECLQKGQGKAVIQAIWDAKTHRPDGILAGEDLDLETVMAAASKGYDLPYPKMTAMLYGLRKRELTLLTAGSGIGKSTLSREIAYHLHQTHGLTIGNVYLEEGVEKTAKGYVAIDQNIPLGMLRANPEVLSKDQWASCHARLISQRMFFYNHFGSLDSDNLLAKLRYMAVSLGVDFIMLDHISIVVSGQESSSEGERKDIDRLMTRLRSLVEETGVGIIAIVHLRQPEGTPHEEGGRVTLSQLRGSGSLKQLSDNVVAMERDQQDASKGNLSRVRLLKNREFGEVGEADLLAYDRNTGRLLPTDEQAASAFKDETQGADDGIPF
ncbi:Archaeal primase DnaG/twinkle, TOPRIM domain [uncultured Caudovirales phage]|uniref:DNA helicase/primase n=1 Tax=uncultured Caudovirales phage TaxID=2100421 RepID=A0A6J5M1D3_9CAUD|nr:Archaeal primase DnaG/twinkle, TOPRIM domain [uncultured Caudovirales phage]